SILLGITGGIAAYKAADLASRLTQAGAAVDVVMTEAATRFVTPLTFETLTRRRVYVGLWDEHPTEPEHISLADRPRLCIIAPATGNTLAKIAHGIADNLLTATVLACRAPLLLAPAMNENMWRHPATQENIRLLRRRGAQVIGPARGWLACGREGEGRMAEAAEIFAAALKILAAKRGTR
ncbi:MAG: bifunctional 4'-phosphopantothenoylcysteine decarboxylase/phosphopantothenoylcysteine synthetase, partial [Planctomycetota bacterium]|nr:bifunctional 4'-phosphopantothenoylcysteine decarboxylase/phosphopantothenoylcysteine synthetase [Planctomycetota bacterium]